MLWKPVSQGGTAIVIRLKPCDYQKIIAHAVAAAPNEACGLIAGNANEGIKIVEKVYPLRNMDDSPLHFAIDPREQLSAIKNMRSLGITPLGNFHSHPQTPARPSEEDIRLAFDVNASYLILSLADTEPVLKAFRMEGGAPVAENIEII
ncbi:MAG: M67 family metallopeptidase [Clostridiales bacterium]|jgi:proteasome lid subunit RPN8/RPN11|nr:M67 family metallopeptidase [Clostridiales bacterium]